MNDDELEALRDELEAALAADVRAALALTAQDFADAVDGVTELVAARFRVSGIGAMWKRRVGGLMARLRGITREGARVVSETVGDPLPDGWDDPLGAYVNATDALLSAVGDRLAADATAALADGLNAGESVGELKARLTALFAGDGVQLGTGRAERIAMTEATRAFNAGALAAAQALTGPDRPLVKQWLTRRDDRVRVQHADTDGQIQFLDDPFDVAGTPMRYPGDPLAPADLTISCRCIMKVTAARQSASGGPVEGNGMDLTAGADGSHTSGGMIALIPTEADAARMAVDGGEPADELHLTLFFLGEGADWDGEARADLVSRVSYAARLLQPVQARAFGAAQWNPDGDEPAWVWNVGHGQGYEGTRLHDAHYEAQYALEDRITGPDIPAQHEPWSPHICARYTSDNVMDALSEKTGPVTFDRIRVTFAGDRHDFQLSAGRYRIGDRVQVAGEPHEASHAVGTVAEINDGPAYGILFDGTDEVHHWYVGDELAYAAEPGPEHVMDAETEPAPVTASWSTPGGTGLAFENQQTGDNRLFTPGALYWTGGPWPLKVQHEEDSAGALAGSIADMRRDGGRIDAHGVLYLTCEAGAEAAMLLSQGAPLGVSVDLDDVDLELVDTTETAAYRARLVAASLLPSPDGGWTLTGETETEWTAAGTSLAGESSRLVFHIGADCRVPVAAFELDAAAGDIDPGGDVVETQRSGTYLMRITRARVRGASLTLIPAFADARITLDDPPAMYASTGLTAAKSGYTGSREHDYDRVVRGVRKSLVPVSASDLSRSLRLPVVDVRRHLARAAKGGKIVRLARGSYVGPQQAGAAAVAELTAAATGSVDLPVADRGRSWDGDAAATRVFSWADGDAAKIGRAFAYRDDDADPLTKAAYKLGYADVISGTLTIIPKGVFAAQAALNGARGGVNIPSDQVAAVREKLDAVRAHVDEVTGEEGRDEMEASAWSAMASMEAMPASWFAEPTDAELPPGGPGVNYDRGRVFGWVAQAGEPHAGFAKKVTIDGLGRIDTAHFLRQRFTLDDGSTVKAGAFTMNVGHHRDGAECETASCQFDDTRTVAGIVTVGMNARGMWFSGAAAPWMSEWDRQVFTTCQPSYHMKKGPSGNWQLRAVLSVPVPGHSSPLLASAVVERSQVALTAAATMVEVETAVASAQRALTVADVAPEAEGLNYDVLAAAIVRAQEAAADRRAREAAELEALIAEAGTLDTSTTTEGV